MSLRSYKIYESQIPIGNRGLKTGYILSFINSIQIFLHWVKSNGCVSTERHSYFANGLREIRVSCSVFRFESLPLRDTLHVTRRKASTEMKRALTICMFTIKRFIINSWLMCRLSATKSNPFNANYANWANNAKKFAPFASHRTCVRCKCSGNSR